jgi:glycosyltransferase involved in cell wall biosynthesis
VTAAGRAGPRRILTAHPFPGLYGSDRMMVAAVGVLQSVGADVTIVVPESGPLLPLLSEARLPTQVIAFPVLRKSMLRPRGLVRIAATTPWHVAVLWRLIRRSRADVVYVNTLTLPHWLLAARFARVPVVCHVREAEEQLGRRSARVLVAPVRLADAVIANSAATGEWLVRHAPRLAGRVRVVYNGFAFADLPQPPTPPAGDRRTRLLVVGRLSPRKGQDVALAAVAELVAAGYDLELHLVGDVFRGYEWYERELREQADRLGIADRIVVAGFAEEPTAAYAESDIVLVPSRLEPFGNVAVEAMALGRPVIASRVGGLPEIVDDGDTGILVPPGDQAALVAAIRSLVDDPGRAARLGTAGAVRVRDRFGRDQSARALLEVFAEVTG